MRHILDAKPHSEGKEEYIRPRLTQRGSLGDSRPQPHWPALDGLRALAVLGVMIVHLGNRLLLGGYLGVDVFFVLSGFLITSLLIGEWEKQRGRVSLRNFYARRSLRLFPALSCIVVASSALAVLEGLAGRVNGPAAGRTTLDAIPWVIFYIGNWNRAFSLSTLGILGHTWSLAVEEQFYLVWPALFIIVISHSRRRKRLALWLSLLALAVMIYRGAMAHLGYSLDRIYFGTDTHCDGLLIGCAAAFWLSSTQPFPLRPTGHRMLKSLTLLGAVTLIILFIFGSLAEASLDISIATVATGVTLVGLVTGTAPSAVERLLSCDLAVWIGRRSYGLYLWHFVTYDVVIAVFDHYSGNYVQGGLSARQIGIDSIYVIAFITSFLIAALSYRFVELPALRLKRRFQSGKRVGGAHRKRPHQARADERGAIREGVWATTD